MTDLFAGGEPLPIPLEAQIAAVDREIGMRIQVYGRRVDAGQMKREKAHAEIAAMRAVLRTLKGLHEAPKQIDQAQLLKMLSDGLGREGDLAGLVVRAVDTISHYKRLEAILEGESDVTDGDEGQQLPNAAMSFLTQWRGPG